MDSKGCCRLLLIILFVYVTQMCNAVDDDKESQERLQNLYKVLHNIAMPKALYDGPSSKRLVMMLPGKVLYDKDYYPSQDYIDFVEGNEREKDRYVEISPIKKQNLFNLVDVVPGIDPLQGQESGESFSAYYREVLGQMDIKGLESLTEDQQKHLQDSVKVLLEEVNDPEAPGKNISRWNLYRRYEEVYNKERERVEAEINNQRNTLPSLEYQYWFQRTYPALQAKVDGAFYDWLISGQKDLVELHKGRLGTSSPGALLLEAKSVLRATGTVALDRSKTIYPVNFVPGNWFKYLKDPGVTLSPDQINIRLGQLEAQKAFLTTIGSYVGDGCDIGQQVNNSKTAYDGKVESLGKNSTALMTKRCKCLVADGNQENADCKSFQATLNLSLENAQEVAFQYQGKAALEAVKSGNEDAVKAMIKGIDNQITELQGSRSSALPEVGEAAEGIAGGNAPTGPWLYFSWTSEETKQTETSSQSSLSTQTSFSASYGLFSVSGNFGYSKSTANSFNSLKRNKVKVAGEIMRVSVQLPWFRPELFRNEQLKLRSKTPFSVSPGPKQTDREFVKAVQDSTRTGQKHYRIPQYITGLLLCRNLDLEFSGLDQQASRSFVATSMSAGLDVGYGPFSLSSSFASSNQKASFNARSTATGLQVKAPGAQVIGYYTEVVPQFPVQDTGE